MTDNRKLGDLANPYRIRGRDQEGEFMARYNLSMAIYLKSTPVALESAVNRTSLKDGPEYIGQGNGQDVRRIEQLHDRH